MPAMSRRIGGTVKIVPRGGVGIQRRRVLIPSGLIKRIVSARGAIHDGLLYKFY